MAATNGASTPTTDGDLMGKPPEGVVYPPEGVRANIAKTAEFINRRGPQLEDELRARSGSLDKFAFINGQDPYHPYFRWYLEQLRQGKGPAAGGKGAVAARDNKPKGPAEPAPFRFSARMPNISAQDLEIVRLTALYTAKNGENWLKSLRNRESNTSQFEFLRPQHSFFQFFRTMVDQYKIILEEESTVEARIDELQKNIENRFHVLDRAKGRAEYVKHVSTQKEKEEKKKEDEQKEYMSIDWQDFAIIATVTFDEADDAADLPAPQTLNDLQSASLEQKATYTLNRRIEEAAPDDDSYYNVSQQQGGYPGYQPVPTPMAPPVQPIYLPTPPPPQDFRSPAQKAREEEQERAAREAQAEQERAALAQAAARGGPNQMRIRTDYVPRAAAKKGNVLMAICPNCRQQIPANEMDEHLRIELLDPRWKEQRDKQDARYAPANNHVDVAGNLKRLASMRDDAYDGNGNAVSEEEAARRKKAALSYDGHPDPARDGVRMQQMQNMNLQDQLRQIKEKHGGR